LSERTSTFFMRVGKPRTVTFKQRFWKVRKDGVKQRYWKKVTRTYKRRIKVTRRLKPRTRLVEYVRTFVYRAGDEEYYGVDVVEVVGSEEKKGGL
jgi:hypothetical protein